MGKWKKELTIDWNSTHLRKQIYLVMLELIWLVVNDSDESSFNFDGKDKFRISVNTIKT